MVIHMETREHRSLRIISNEGLVQQYSRATLSGRDTLSFLPNAFELQLWNLSSSEDNLLSSAKTLQVEVPVSRGPQSEIRPSQTEDHRPGDPRWENEWMQGTNVSLSLLAFGTISEVYREKTQQGTITTVTFSPLLPLWTSRVILDVPAGKKVSETVSMILSATGTQIRLLYYPRYHDPVRSRGQSFSGRAAECISDAVSFAGARAMVAPSGVCIVPEGGAGTSIYITDGDLLSEPSYVAEKRMVLRTNVVGWSVGKTASVSWKGTTTTGIIRERSLDLDTAASGPWRAELYLEVLPQ